MSNTPLPPWATDIYRDATFQNLPSLRRFVSSQTTYLRRDRTSLANLDSEMKSLAQAKDLVAHLKDQGAYRRAEEQLQDAQVKRE